MNPSESVPDPAAPVAGESPTPSSPEPPPLSVKSPLPTEKKADAPILKEPSKKEKDKEKEKGQDKDKDKDRDKDKGKKKKKQKEETRKADPWQRYKALLDTLKESQDLVDLADHKARFALMIMGALNAAILFAGTRSELLTRIPAHLKPWFYLYFGIYAFVAIYFLLQAIESLRPRRHPPLPRKSTISEKDESLGLRFFAEALRYDAPTYHDAWQSVRVSQLNAEMTSQIYTIARINNAKYAAVSRLYLGLKAITVLTAVLLIVMGSIAWIDLHYTTPAGPEAAAELSEPHKTKAGKERNAAESEESVKIKMGKPEKGGWSILGVPERLEATGVREPSGIAFDPIRKSFFLVGDEGSLVELSTAGKPIGQIPASGNLEDLAFHTPSGRLVLLSEKKSELLVVDPATGKRTGKFKLDDEALLGEVPADKNQGFEGIAFRPEAGRPGGGVFYLVHQRAPAVMVTMAFDPTAATGSVGADALIRRTPVPNREDLTAVTYDAALDRLFVIADSKDRLVMLSVSGEEEAEIVLPGAQQEGMTFDPEGNLWIADDRAGLLVFRGARARIQAAIKNPPPEPAKDASNHTAGNEN
ncbi:MAG: SdiA-regulated domain-containing protein [Vicinamibacteria bacterium]